MVAPRTNRPSARSRFAVVALAALALAPAVPVAAAEGDAIAFSAEGACNLATVTAPAPADCSASHEGAVAMVGCAWEWCDVRLSASMRARGGVGFAISYQLAALTEHRTVVVCGGSLPSASVWDAGCRDTVTVHVTVPALECADLVVQTKVSQNGAFGVKLMSGFEVCRGADDSATLTPR